MAFGTWPFFLHICAFVVVVSLGVVSLVVVVVIVGGEEEEVGPQRTQIKQRDRRPDFVDAQQLAPCRFGMRPNLAVGALLLATIIISIISIIIGRGLDGRARRKEGGGGGGGVSGGST